MTEKTTLGSHLRRERERQGLTLRTISEKTKVSFSLLEGLEADDVSRWPGGIFRRAFVRSYAECVGLNADEIIRWFEEQFHPSDPELAGALAGPHNGTAIHFQQSIPLGPGSAAQRVAAVSGRARVLGTAADLAVAVVLAFSSAAAGSRLLWPVLFIATYYAIGVLITGTTPMVALLDDMASHASRARRPIQPPPSRSSTETPLRHGSGAQVRST
jgi:transcriptional regulator with XRE-family HTH domain